MTSHTLLAHNGPGCSKWLFFFSIILLLKIQWTGEEIWDHQGGEVGDEERIGWRVNE